MTLSEQQIAALVQDFARKYKGWAGKSKSRPMDWITKDPADGSTLYPEYWPGYNYAVKQYKEIEVHTRQDVFPERLFAKRAPNQTEDQYKYLKGSYQAITVPEFEEFKNVISRIYGEQLWSVQVPAVGTEGETYQEYITEQMYRVRNLEQWFKANMPSLKIKDPNGLIVVDAEYSTEYDDNGNEVYSSDRPMPYPEYYPSPRVVARKLGEYYMVISYDKSMVEYNGTMKKEGIVLEIYTSTQYISVKQVGKQIDYKFGQPEIIEHTAGTCPVWVIGGSPVIIDDEMVFNSPFYTAVPLLNLVLLDSSYLNASKATCAYPHEVSIGIPCDFKDTQGNTCSNGVIFDRMSGNERQCAACNGTGLRSRMGPTGKLLVNPGTDLSPSRDAEIRPPHLAFVAPPTETLAFLRSEIIAHTNKARQILHIGETEAKEEGLTAAGSMNRQRSVHAFLKPNSDQIFHIMEGVYNAVGNIRYPGEFTSVNFTYPQSFDEMQPSDYLVTIGESIKLGVPPSVVFHQVYHYLRSLAFTDEKTTRFYQLIVEADQLLMLSQNDIISRINSGIVEKWQDVLHQSAPQLIMELMRLHVPTDLAPEFFDLPMTDQIAALESLAKSKLAEIGDPVQQIQAAILATGGAA